MNETLIDMYSPNEQRGVKDTGLLQSAIYRPQQTVAQEDAYPTIFHKATALFESLAKNHAFYNANKSTALACLEMFLLYNEYELKMSEQESSDFTVNVVVQRLSFEEILKIIKENSSKLPLN
ncbi:type II toxin-antitoxin system death-on-curing family toxin [Bacillus thuringiensis]|uniref:type II toxin-antitoxin system death-on-curing family toxin n=1 Tax=Bacillus thuringiensis TaxID=1428 RepID=UPI000A36F587|nr:type II toxin-antitoxin system death-on-curing family toxin [Bacillus thuringiensis]OTY35200.1 death-on-curing family protein [Bacillus thuringiensis serovar alesti]